MQHHAASRSRSCSGETANGDRAVVRALDDGVLLAVIDGLGHGPEAERAAVLAADVLATHAPDGVIVLLEAMHRALRGSRGAAATLALASGSSISIVGVGNVAARIFGGQKLAPRAAPGIVGHSLPRGLRPLDATLGGPVRLVITSDGVSSRISAADLDGLTPERACERLIEHHSIARDDATALVADLAPPAAPR